MATTAPYMGLKVWNLQTDPYDHAQLADNWARVDQHDHSEGKGKQIPTAGLADGAVSSAKIGTAQVVDTNLASPQSGLYRNVLQGAGTVIAEAEGTKYFPPGGGLLNATATNGSQFIWISSADFSAANKTVKFRVRAQQATTSTAPSSTLTVGMYKAGSVASGVFTSLELVTGSTVAFTTTGANEIKQGTSGDFVLPSAEAYYIFGVVFSVKTAASSGHGLSYQLQVRNV